MAREPYVNVRLVVAIMSHLVVLMCLHVADLSVASRHTIWFRSSASVLLLWQLK